MLLHYLNHQAPKEKRKTLKIFQINMGIGRPANDLAFALLFEEKVDILLIDEPWIAADLEKRLSKRHKSNQVYAPGEDWKKRPRVIIYIRGQTSLRFVEKKKDILKFTDEMPDILLLEGQPSIDKEPVYIINSHNTPIGSKRANRSVDIMMEVPELLNKGVLIMRHFNPHNTNWNNCTVNPTPQAKRFTDWIVNKNVNYLYNSCLFFRFFFRYLGEAIP